GLAVSALGFGCGAVGGLMVLGEPAEQRRSVETALEAGVTYFDTAPGYGDGASETNLGRVLRELGAWDRVVVGTKVRLAPDDLADVETAVRRSVEASLARLAHDHVDLIQLHNRVALADGASSGGGVGLHDVLGDIAGALRAVVAAGHARHVGFTGLGDAEAVGEVLRASTFETMQTYFNALNPSAGYAGHSAGQQDFLNVIDSAARAGVGVIGIRPLAAGAASGEATRAANAGDPGSGIVAGAAYEADRARAQALGPLAAELGLDGPVELALRFVLSKPGVATMLVGLSSFDQLQAALRWANRGSLPDDAVRRVLELAA
ncbi:MAG: aldo/keto reductase, partial [Chloroflexi bacterium]|nr:aldo/keto reductase [Chloroflexota bacterium]